MEITWLGRTCFRLRGRERTVLTDPPPPDSGYRIGKVESDIVTVSRSGDPAYSYTDALKNGALLLDAPGEYEVGGVLVTGVAMTRGDGPRNVAFVVEIDGIKVCHLGVPSTVAGAALDAVKGVDILCLPVGGALSLQPAAAADLMTTIDARITIPMHFKTDVETFDLDPLDRFLKETGAKPEPQPRLQITKSSLPAELTVVVLEPRA